MNDESPRDPAVRPIGASRGGRSTPPCLPGASPCTRPAQPWHADAMHLMLATNPTPEWIIGEEAMGGDAWLVHAIVPRFVASVRHHSSLADGEPAIRLDCGLVLVDLRWLGPPSRQVNVNELITRADRTLHAWLQRQLTRASRAA